MKFLGIVRRTDQLGRLVIPKEIRDQQGWKPNTPMEMFLTDEGLLVREYGLTQEKKDLIVQLQTLKEATENLEAREIYSRAVELIKRGEE